jgi:hypothetical protein
MSRVVTAGAFLIGICAFVAGCATSDYGLLPDVVTLVDNGGSPVVGATILPVQEVLASFETYYTQAEKIRRSSNVDGRARVDLAKQLSKMSGKYLFRVSKVAYRDVVVEISPVDFHGTITVEMAPADTPPNKSADSTASAGTPAAEQPRVPASTASHL